MRLLQHTFAVAALSFAAVAGAQGTAAAQAKPNFSGQWELNAAKSDLGGAPAPALSATITQNDTAFTFAQTVNGQTGSQVFPLKAGPSTWTTPGGQPVTTTPAWDGGTLVVTSKAQRGGVDVTQVNRWSLSPDGKTMTMLQEMATPGGAMTFRLVFDKKS